MPCSRISDLEKFAGALVTGATLELYLTPKPGLVDRADNGSHPDLSLATMERSIAQIDDYLGQIVDSLVSDAPFSEQRQIAVAAEQRLVATLSTNTHKGYIFLSGMLLIARWHAASASEAALRESLSTRAAAFFTTRTASASNGQKVREKYGASGIVRESIAGLPAVFEQALPAFRHTLNEHGCLQTASFGLLARLMQCVEDTTTLHRAGPPGLARIQADGRRLEELIAGGEDPAAWLAALNRSYVSLNITMGGVADMLGIAYSWLIASGEIVGDRWTGPLMSDPLVAICH